MKKSRALLLPFIGSIFVLILLSGCPMPQDAVKQALSGGGQTSTDPGSPALPLAVQTDAARNQGIFVDEKGQKIDIRSTEPDGTIANCADAVGIAVEESFAAQTGARTSVGAPPLGLKAAVVGMRADGFPGLWVILWDNSIVPAGDLSSGKNSSCLPECDDRDGGLRGRFGWRYFVTGISENMRMIVGYAINEKGFHFGRIDIEAGTTVGVYWKIERKAFRPFAFVDRAQVIGVLDQAKRPPHRSRIPPWFDWLLKKMLSKLQLFFLDYFSSYLIMTTGVSYDKVKDTYTVAGTDQDGKKAVATIDSRNRITIAVVVEPTDKPDLAVTAVIVPGTSQKTAHSGSWAQPSAT